MINLYPNCIPIIGHTQIAIYDLEKQCAKTVPKEDFFNPNGSVTNPFFEKDQLRVEAEKWLFDNHFLMPVQDNEILQLLKPSSYKNWKSPARITNAVIEPTTVNGLLDAANFRKFLSFLQPLLCNHIFVKITELVSLKVLKDVIESFDGTTIQSVELLVMYQPDFYTDEFAELILNQQRIRFVIIQASPFEKNIEEK